MKKEAYTYILASKKNGTLYVGVTSNLKRRLHEHKTHVNDGFTKRYNVTNLVWYTSGDDIRSAIILEKKIKNRCRQWKINLIEKNNPNWVDLSADWFAGEEMDSATDAQSDNMTDAQSCHSAVSTANSQSCHSAVSTANSQSPKETK